MLRVRVWRRRRLQAALGTERSGGGGVGGDRLKKEMIRVDGRKGEGRKPSREIAWWPEMAQAIVFEQTGLGKG